MHHPFRVFISYSHGDSKLAEQVAVVLTGMKLTPFLDKDIQAGRPFSDAIKRQIANSHLFMPLISENSQQRPWVHQETGYAMANNIPVLPVAFGKIPGEMIAQLQAISIELNPADEFDKTDLIEKLKCSNIERLVLSPPANAVAIMEVADYAEDRTMMMARYANRVVELASSYVHLRQRGALSSFSIPNRILSDPVWKLREDGSPYYQDLLRKERIELEDHARQSGCSLMLDPESAIARMSKDNPTRMRARLSTLLEFLESMPDDKIKVVIFRRSQGGNVTILGDWFVAESQARRGAGYRQTVFRWHAPTVLSELRKFDQEFDERCRQIGAESCGARCAAIAKIEEIIDGLPASNNS